MLKKQLLGSLRPNRNRFLSNVANDHLFVKSQQSTAGDQISEESTHEILQDFGYVRQPSAGTIHWLPLGLRVLRNIEAIIRKHMDGAGCEEFLLSSLSRKENWIKTNRWSNTELFKLNVNSSDHKDPDFCLTPTHEEEITTLVGSSLINESNLPIVAYQISTKYRLEKRPRAGLLRGREFVMKDAYSFDSSRENALETFQRISDAYSKIFKELRVPFERAQADSGEIGGSLSQEWHLVSPKGEDLIFKCDGCNYVSNIEVAQTLPDENDEYASSAKVEYFLTNDKETFVAVYFPQDRNLNLNKVKELVEDVDLSSNKIELNDVLKAFAPSEDDMILKKIIRIMDMRVDNNTDLPDFPLSTFQKNNFSLLTDTDIVDAIDGEICAKCEEGKVHSQNAIEVGHCFYLGKRYSIPLKAYYKTAKDNSNEFYEMGCYGIGVSRLVASIAEITRDKVGLRWPASIAPFDLTLIEAPNCNDSHSEEVRDILKEKFKVQLDKRAPNKFGLKIKESKSSGIPLLVIVGKKFPKVEIEVRGNRWLPSSTAAQYDYQKLYENYRDSELWEIDSSKGIEKHVVHKDILANVLESLLKDL